MAKYVAAHGMTEGEKRKINRECGPKKNIIFVAEKEQQVLDSVPKGHRKDLEKLIKEYGISFLKSCQRVYLPHEKCSIMLRSNQAANLLTDHHIG